jgi:hypothetical protein
VELLASIALRLVSTRAIGDSSPSPQLSIVALRTDYPQAHPHSHRPNFACFIPPAHISPVPHLVIRRIGTASTTGLVFSDVVKDPSRCHPAVSGLGAGTQGRALMHAFTSCKRSSLALDESVVLDQLVLGQSRERRQMLAAARWWVPGFESCSSIRDSAHLPCRPNAVCIGLQPSLEQLWRSA